MRLFPLILFSALTVALSADTLILKSGSPLQGTYLGGDAHFVRFAVGDQTIRTYPVDQVSSVSFGSGAVPIASAPAKAAAPASELPAGTSVVVRLIDAIDSQRDQVGQVFRASLDQPLAINTAVVASRGSDAVVELVDADPHGSFVGRSELTVTLKSVTIRNHIYPVEARTVAKSGPSQGRRTATMMGAGSGIGAIAGAIAGGGRGAAIGAGSGAAGGALANMILRGPQVRIPSETRLQFDLTAPVSVDLTARPF